MRFFLMFVTAVCVLLHICGGVGAEGWFPVPFDGLVHLHIFVRSLKPDRKCTTATLGIGTAYIYHSVGRLQVSAPFLSSEAKGCGIVSQTSFSLSLI